MTAKFTRARLVLFALAGVLLVSVAGSVSGKIVATNRYHQFNLVSDVPGLARWLDSNLVNPWGIAFSPTSPFWISNNGTGTSTVYDRLGRKFPRGNPLVVTIPPAAGSPAGSKGVPTGMVFNPTSDFQFTFNGVMAAPTFMWVTEDGTIAGWNFAWSRNNAFTLVDNSSLGAVYKGVDIASFNGNNYLYAADFHNGKIDIFDHLLTPVTTVSNASPFIDPNLPSGYAPFNIHNIGGNLYVMYAVQDSDAHDDVPGAGLGIVDVYTPDGTFVKRLISNGAQLNAPWGIAMAPGNFGVFSNDLLVGNFGDGKINAFDPATGNYLGTIMDKHGTSPIVIDGLWSIAFGSGGGNGGRANALYFTAGIQGESHGLFGQINTIPGGDD